jgi:hypothetical protein
VDVGLRLDPGRPWSSWRVYLDVRRDAGDPDVEVELGVGDLARAAGGVVYRVARESVDRLFGGERDSR